MAPTPFVEEGKTFERTQISTNPVNFGLGFPSVLVGTGYGSKGGSPWCDSRGTFTGYGTLTGTARSAEVQGAGPSQGQQTQGLGRVRKDFVLVNTLARGKDLARTPDKLGQTSGHDSVSLAEPWASTSGQASLTSEKRHSLATKYAGPSALGFHEKADFKRGASPFVRRRVTPSFCTVSCTIMETDTLSALLE